MTWSPRRRSRRQAAPPTPRGYQANALASCSADRMSGPLVPRSAGRGGLAMTSARRRRKLIAVASRAVAGGQTPGASATDPFRVGAAARAGATFLRGNAFVHRRLCHLLCSCWGDAIPLGLRRRRATARAAACLCGARRSVAVPSDLGAPGRMGAELSLRPPGAPLGPAPRPFRQRPRRAAAVFSFAQKKTPPSCGSRLTALRRRCLARAPADKRGGPCLHISRRCKHKSKRSLRAKLRKRRKPLLEHTAITTAIPARGLHTVRCGQAAHGAAQCAVASPSRA